MTSLVLTITSLRLVLATMGLVYILLTNPRSLLLGPLGHFIQNFLPGSSPLNLLVPGLVCELVCDLLVVVGVTRHLLLCLLPWLMLNIMLSLGLGTAVMALIGTINMDTNTNLESAGAMNEVRTLLLIILLNIFLIMAIIHLHAVIKVSQETKENRAKTYDISATENVMTMNVTDDQSAAESLIRKEIYIPSGGLGQPVHDSSFDSYDEVP